MDFTHKQPLQSSIQNKREDDHSTSEQALQGFPYTTILEQMAESLLALDTQWRITYLNHQA